MSRKLKEKFEKKEPEEEKNTPSEDGNFSKESDSFELDNTDDAKGEETQSKKKSSVNIQGEYFTEEDYRKTLKNKENKNEDLIDKFIKKFPEMENIHPKKGNEPNEDISLPSVEENEEIYSEKLIGIFVQQGYYEKAISAYEKLSLKYPKKSDYFAAQIEKLKEIINKQQK
jgi:tetratricopeptide (TPR) repeat protein